MQTALSSGDVDALGRMYENFYRDPCSKGLVATPRSWVGASDREYIDDAELRVMLQQTQYRIECWRSYTSGRYPIAALESPGVGRPFGVWVEETFIVPRAEYHHASAVRTAALAGADSTIVEIGGGHGAMAYHLLRAANRIRYIDFDLPETLALAAYYLAHALPQHDLVLCGEEGGSLEESPAGSITLLPPWKMPCLGNKSAGVTFSSHLLCDLEPAARERYLVEIARFTSGYLVDWGREDPDALKEFERHFELVERRRAAWHLYRDPDARECELLLRPRDQPSTNRASCSSPVR